MVIAPFVIHILVTTIIVVKQTLILKSTIFIHVRDDELFSLEIAIMAFISGLFLLMGQSIVLFINRVSLRRLLVIIFINAFFYVVDLYICTAAVWVAIFLLLHINLSFFSLARVIFLGCVPFIFSILILAPHFGVFISRLIRAWSFTIIFFGIIYAFHLDFLSAFSVTGFGWLVMLVFNQLLNRPFLTLKDLYWKQNTNKTLHDLLFYLQK